jgi:hypothetical protein
VTNLDPAPDPKLANATNDLNALAQKFGQELQAEDDRAMFALRLKAIAFRYGPSVLEAAVRAFLSFEGIPLPVPTESAQKGAAP